MTTNLLLWRWSADCDTPAKRRRQGILMRDVTAGFAQSQAHPAIGPADIAGFARALDAAFGTDPEARPFVFHDHGACAVIECGNAARIELIPRVAAIGARFGLNASEF